MNIINTLKNFFVIQDWKLVVAGLGMLVIFLLIVYLLSLITISFQRRKAAVSVSLPDINTYGKKDDNLKQFEEPKVFEVELITPDDDVIEEEPKDNEELFLTALSIETRKYIPKSDDKIKMPEVGEMDYQAIKMEKTRERTQSALDRLKRIAKADEESFIDINNGGVI